MPVCTEGEGDTEGGQEEEGGQEGEEDFEDPGLQDRLRLCQFRKACAWYHITYNPDYCQRQTAGASRVPHLFSFAWIPYRYLCELKRLQGSG